MDTSRRFFPVLFATAILGTSVPTVVLADPVTITSGNISVPASSFRSSAIQLQGTDGVFGFSFAGFISPDSSIAIRSCMPCDRTATTVALAISSNGQDLTGMLTYGDDHYRVGGVSDTVGNVFLSINGFALLPPAPSMTNELATITAPFFVQRAFFAPPERGGPFGSGNTLLGSGWATVSLYAENPGDGVPHWSLVSAEYRFGDQAPIPEPASFLLLASGLAGLAMQRKKAPRA